MKSSANMVSTTNSTADASSAWHRQASRLDRNQAIEPDFDRKGGQTVVLMCQYYVVFTLGGWLIAFVHYNSAKRNTNEHINIEKDIDRHGLGGSTLSLLQK